MNDELTEARENLARFANNPREILFDRTVPELKATIRTLLAALDQRDAEVERLRTELEKAVERGDQKAEWAVREARKAMEAEARAQAAEQRLKAVTEALEPFAEQANCYTADDRDTAADWPTFEVGHFRRAAQAIAAAQAPAGENSDEQ